MLIQSLIKYKILQGNIPAEIFHKGKCIQLYVVPSTRGHNLSFITITRIFRNFGYSDAPNNSDTPNPPWDPELTQSRAAFCYQQFRTLPSEDSVNIASSSLTQTIL